jgi:hypothetical protein
MASVPSCPTNTQNSVAPLRNPASAAGVRLRVSDGTRTRDRLDHNQELYQLSYAHHVPPAGATFAI